MRDIRQEELENKSMRALFKKDNPFVVAINGDLEGALTALQWRMANLGISGVLRQRRHFIKPSEFKRLKRWKSEQRHKRQRVR